MSAEDKRRKGHHTKAAVLSDDLYLAKRLTENTLNAVYVQPAETTWDALALQLKQD